MQLGQIIVQLGTDLRNFEAGLRQATRDARAAARQMEQAFRQSFGMAEDQASRLGRQLQEVGRIVSGILISQAFYNSMNAIENATGALFEYSMQLEDMNTKWQSIMGDMEQSTKWMGAMQHFAQRTPFDLKSVDAASTKIKMMGVESKAVLPILETVGNAVAINGGDSLQLTRISTALRQMWASPKAQAEELEQFVEGQIDAAKYLKEQLGLSAQEIKKIGDTGISGRTAALAILRGMATDPAYQDGMKKLSENTRGMINSIKEGALHLGAMVSNSVFKKISGFIRKIRDTIDKMVEVYRKDGLGGIFEEFIPKNLHGEIRTIVATLQQMWQTAVQIFNSLKPMFGEFFTLFIQSMAVLGPMVLTIMRLFAQILQYLQPIMPLLGKLLFLLVSLGIIRTIAFSIAIFVRALRFLWGALRVAGVLAGFGRILAGLLAVLANPWVAAAAGVAFGLYKIAEAAGLTTGWIEKLMARLAQLFNLDISKILQPLNNPDDGLGDFIDEHTQDFLDLTDADLGGLGEGIDEAGDAAAGANKELEKFLAAFDEVYQVPEKNNSGSGSGGVGGSNPFEDITFDPGGGGDGTNDLPKDLENIVPNEIEIPLIPIWKKPANLNVTWNWTPGPPGAMATAWVTAMNTMRDAIKEFAADSVVLQGILSGLAGVLVPGYALNRAIEGWKALTTTIGDMIDTLTTATEESRGFGGVFGGAIEQALNALGPFGSMLRGLRDNLKEVFADMGTAAGGFATNVGNVFNSILETVGQFGVNYGPAMTTAFGPVGAIIASAMKLGLEEHRKGLADIRENIKSFAAEYAPLFENAFTAPTVPSLAAVIAFVAKHKEELGKVKENVTAFGKEYAPMFGKVFLGPIGVVLAAFDSLPATIKEKLGEVKEKIGEFGKEHGSIFPKIFLGPLGIIVAAFESTPEEIKKKLGNFGEKIGNFFKENKNPILIGAGVIVAGLLAVFGSIPAGITAAVALFISTITGGLIGGKDKTKNAAGEVAAAMRESFNSSLAGWESDVEESIVGVTDEIGEMPPKIGVALKPVPKTLNEPFKDWDEDIKDKIVSIEGEFDNMPKTVKASMIPIPENLREPFEKWDGEVGKKIKEVVDQFPSVPTTISKALETVRNSVFNPFSHWNKDVKTETDKTINTNFPSVPSRIASAIRTVGNTLINPFNPWSGQVSGKVTDTVGKFNTLGSRISSQTSNVSGTLINPFNPWSGQVSGKVTDTVTKFNTLASRISNQTSNIPGTLLSPFNAFPGGVGSLISAVVTAFSNLPNKIKNAISSIPSIIASILGEIKLPSFTTSAHGVGALFTKLKNLAGFANGGIIGKDSIVRVGERGRREAIIPLQNGSAMAPFADAVAQRLGSFGSMGGGQQGEPQPTMYVGTLIADDRSLRELERKMRVIRINESQRGVF
jgi:tape measure domain-containing protein